MFLLIRRHFRIGSVLSLKVPTGGFRRYFFGWANAISRQQRFALGAFRCVRQQVFESPRPRKFWAFAAHQPDIVSICTWTGLHAEMIAATAAARPQKFLLFIPVNLPLCGC